MTAASSRVFVPFALAGAFFALLLCVLVRHGLHVNHGTFVYPLDDAYIHLDVSRNVALHGVWGISRQSFSGASSSPLWTLLLALVIKAAGVNVATPLVLNGLAGLGLLWVASWLLANALPASSDRFRAAVLVVLVLATPLPGVALLGMEHVLHALAMLGFLSMAAVVLGRPQAEPLTLIQLCGLSVLGLLCGGLRYESCFAIAVVLAALVWRKRIVAAVAVALASPLVPLGYALYSRARSGFALPFSVVMKSATRGGSHNAWGQLLNSSEAPLFLLLATLLLLRVRLAKIRDESGDAFWTLGTGYAVLVTATTMLHMVFGPAGWLMRYEAYLYAAGLPAIGILLHDLWDAQDEPDRQWDFVAFALVIASLPQMLFVVKRAQHGYEDVAVSLHDRYVEHLGQALFVGEAYPHAAVVANDIGFLAFYAPGVKILDPLGLGSVEPVKALCAHQTVNPEFMQAWANREGAQLGIVHTDFPGTDQLVPAGWTLVEAWCFPHNLLFQNHVESFYAPAAAADDLRSKLAAFRDVAPEIVRYRFAVAGGIPPVPERGESAVCPAVKGSSE